MPMIVKSGVRPRPAAASRASPRLAIVRAPTPRLPELGECQSKPTRIRRSADMEVLNGERRGPPDPAARLVLDWAPEIKCPNSDHASASHSLFPASVR